MNTLLSEIYMLVVQEKPDTIRRDCELSEQLKQLIASYKMQLDEQSREDLWDMLAAAALFGKQAGFEAGVKFALEVYAELMRNEPPAAKNVS